MLTKAGVQGYEPSPFFFWQSRADEKRLVAWTSDLVQLKKLLYSVLQAFPPQVEILLKISREAERGKDDWQRFCGGASLARLHKVIRAHEAFVFQDGSCQLCVRREDTGEYLALDEHGVLFVYSAAEVFARMCREEGFEERVEKLIFESGHWHRIPKESEEQRERFVSMLGLVEVR